MRARSTWGWGYALTEELQLKDGRIASKDLRSLGILRAKDMPEVECIFIEENEPAGPYGAKGVGEIGLIPTAPAVAAALYKFDGIRRTKLPMKDSPGREGDPRQEVRGALRRQAVRQSERDHRASASIVREGEGAGEECPLVFGEAHGQRTTLTRRKIPPHSDRQ